MGAPELLAERNVADWTKLVTRAPRTGTARDSLRSFVYLVGRDRRGRPLREDNYTSIFCDIFEFCFDRRIHTSHVSPPTIGKSTLIRLASTWVLGNDPELSIVYICGEESQAVNAVSFCRKVILAEPYPAVFPEVRPDLRAQGRSAQDTRGWEKGQFFLLGTGHGVDAAMEAVAAQPVGEGRRTDLLVGDDIMTRLIAESPVRRASLCAAVDETWIEGRLAEQGMAWLSQNCWHTKDLAHQKREDEKVFSWWVGVRNDCEGFFIRMWNVPAGLPILERPEDYDCEVVRPMEKAQAEVHFPFPADHSVFNAENARDKRKTKPPTFRRLWQLKALTDKDRMFPAWPNRNQPAELVSDLLKLPRKGPLPIVPRARQGDIGFAAGLDIGGEKRPGDVLWILARMPDMLIVPVECHAGTFGISDIVNILDAAWARGVRIGVLMVETNAIQIKIKSEIVKLALEKGSPWAGRIIGHMTGKNKADPDLGLPAIDVELETGAIVWPSKESQTDTAHALTWLEAEAEFEECPRFPGRTTSDKVMAFWFARLGLDRVTVRRGPSGSEVTGAFSARRRATVGY